MTLPSDSSPACRTVFVVDDDPGVRQMIARMVRSIGLQVEVYASVEDFLQAYDDSRLGCLVLDIRMPGESGLALQERLVAKGAAIPIVFITGHGSIRASVQAMKHGAVDFLEKPFDDQALLDAIHKALASAAERRHWESRRADVQARLARLTPREHEVLLHVVAGLANKQIASRLGTTEQTVKVHRGRVMTKMQAESLPELVLLAQLAGAVPTPS
jgi:two-component system, LuxR family, response regulator FixJ